MCHCVVQDAKVSLYAVRCQTVPYRSHKKWKQEVLVTRQQQKWEKILEYITVIDVTVG